MLMLIIVARLLHRKKLNFNTSHVNVNPYTWTDSSRDYSISIHLMLMLIVYGRPTSIQCYGNFNTSHVNVNHSSMNHHLSYSHYFNTSHVNVNLNSLSAFNVAFIISIHLMLMLIFFAIYFFYWLAKFQYISC